MTTPALRTRKPTGRVPWPLILVEGGEKSGKSWAAAQFSTSSRIGPMYWIDLGEGAADEYGAIPGANYLVVEHDGTWAQIQGAVDAVKAEAARAADAGDPPVVLVIDSMTAEWELLKDWASNKARQRFNKRARENRRPEMAADEEPKISMDLWNEAGGRHRKLMTALMTFPGIAIVTARGKDVAALNDKGEPIANTRDYRVEGHKTLGYDASCWIRLDRAKPGVVVGVRSVHVGLRPGYDEPLSLARDWSIEGIVFDTLGCQPAEAHTRNLVELAPNEPDEEPQDGPSGRAFELLTQIGAAGDKDTLGAAWKAIGAALTANVISQTDADKLSEHWKLRKAEVLAEPKNPGNDPQRRRMMALFTQADLAERDDRLAYCAEVTGRDVASTNDLTDDEVRAVIERLESFVKQMEPAGAPA